MKLIRLFTLLCLTIASQQVFGAEGQKFFQPDDKQHVVTPVVGLNISQVESRGPLNFESQSTSILAGVAYEYGLIENLSLGVRQTYNYSSSSLDSDFQYDSKGLNDLNILLKGFFRLSDQWTLRYGFVGSMSFENSKYDNSGNPENSYSGSNKITPYLGADVLLNDQHRIGGKLSREILIGERTSENSNGVTSDSTGGESTTVEAFYEFQFNSDLVGGSLEYIHAASTSGSAGPLGDDYTFLGANIYAFFEVDEVVTLVPTIRNYRLLDRNLNGVEYETFTITSVILSARFAF